MSTCLRTIVQHVANRQQNDPNIPDVVANMISIFQSMSPYHFKQYYQSFQPGDQTGRMNMIDMINDGHKRHRGHDDHSEDMMTNQRK